MRIAEVAGQPGRNLSFEPEAQRVTVVVADGSARYLDTVDAVEEFLFAFGEDALGAGTTPDAIRDATPPALERLAPHRDLVTQRFASIVADREKS